ncbi:MAG: cardiolipin synthase [Gammaproteobacteria bacterium]|nr:cardiolipin synthase [Gammaproteobacteria bacterium]
MHNKLQFKGDANILFPPKVLSSRPVTGILLICLSLLTACASLPDTNDFLDTSVRKHSAPRLENARGPLSAQQSKAILDKLSAQAGNPDIMQRHLAFTEAIVESPLVIGNQVRLLQDGPSTYSAMFSAIQSAKNHINMETFTIEDDEVGQRFADALIEKQQQGVQVSLIYDSVGSLGTPAAFFERLKEHGIGVLEFNPISPLQAKKAWSLTHRDHRKLLIIDGTTLFTGGVNISKVYSSAPFKRRGADDAEKTSTGWRDTHTRIEGPVVAEFQKEFLKTWEKQKGQLLAASNYFPALTKKGNDVVQAVATSPDDPLSLIYLTLVSAITHAESSINLTNAYFVPDQQLLDALKDAAKRGVNVKMVLPSYSDFWPVFHAGRSHYSELLEAGVKIYERRDALLHAKTASIDGVWSTIGSTNLDWRSFLNNDEINAVVLGRDFADEMESAFEKDIAQSNPIILEEWQKRPLSVRMKEAAALLWQRLL